MELSFKFSTSGLLKFGTWVFLFGCLAVFFLTNLGIEPAELWDESTNINVVTETLDGGGLLDLQYQGEPFWEKPPLWYLVTAGLVQILGDNIIVFRLVSAISGIFFGLGIFYLLQKYHSRLAGFLGVAIFLSIPQLHFVSDRFFSTHTFRTADLDSLQLTFMLYSSIFFLEYLHKKSKRSFYVGTILSALAFLTKGPFGILPILATILTSLAVNKKELAIELRKREYWIGLCIFLTVVMPWHIYMLLFYGREFFDVYMTKHLFLRSVSRIDGHNNNLLYYFKILVSPSMFVPVELLIISVVRFVKAKLSKELKYYLLIFAVLSFLIIELVQTRLAWYLFYFYLPTILIMGLGLAEIIKKQKIYFYEVFLILLLIMRLSIYSLF